MKVVEVRWIDADISVDDFQQSDEENSKPVDRWTVGYYIGETEDVLILATDYYENPKEWHAARMRIPWGCIKEYWTHG